MQGENPRVYRLNMSVRKSGLLHGEVGCNDDVQWEKVCLKRLGTGSARKPRRQRTLSTSWAERKRNRYAQRYAWVATWRLLSWSESPWSRRTRVQNLRHRLDSGWPRT